MRYHRQPAVGLLAACLAVSVVPGCGAFGGESRLEEALSLVPADAITVLFTDVSAAEERLGFEGLSSESAEGDIDAFNQKVFDESPWSSTRLHRQPLDPAEWGWGASDVEWSVDTPGVQVYRLRDDLDMDVVADGFREHGYEESEEDGRLRFTRGSGSDPASVYVFADVVLVPADHLLVSGGEADGVIEVRADEAESLADVDPVGELLEDTEGVEFASVMGADASCQDNFLVERLPAQARDLVSEEVRDLQPPEASVLLIGPRDGDEVGVSVLSSYADDEAAEADEEARTDYLSGGRSFTTMESLSEVLTVADTERDGDVVRFELDFADGPQRAVSMITNLDTPWQLCPIE